MNMFQVICFIVAVSIARNDAAKLTETQKSKIYGMMISSSMECMRDFPLSLDHIKSLRNKKLPDDEVAKCFAHCLYKKLGLVNNHGKLSQKKAKETVKKIFTEDDEMVANIDELFSRCIHVNDAETSDGDKGCDRAKLATDCFMKHVTELGLDVDF